MIKRNKKICKGCQTMQFLFGRGLCQRCYARANPPKIKKVSDRQKEILKDYTPIRKKYLEAHPRCEAKFRGCSGVATDIHHLAGKASRKLYLNPENFMAVCRSCHNEIEDMGSEVYELGFKIRRI